MVTVVFIVLLTGLIFRSWVTLLSLSSGDWPYLFLENIKEFTWLPEIRFLWLAPYYQILTKVVVEHLRIPWEITEKLFWFLPFIVLSLISSYKLTKSALGALVYTTNTYILMIIGGGQLGISLSYALAPMVLKSFIDSKYVFFMGVVLAAQAMFDPRIAVLILVASIVYHLFAYQNLYGFAQIIKRIGISIIIALTVHLYWILPLLRSQTIIARQVGEATAGSVKFLSFATFEQTISLLHANWPENVFGKVYFMRSEFLLLPLIAFSSLLFLQRATRNLAEHYAERRRTLFFCLLALVGSFLAKGTNPPFGEVYIWLFEHVPGFSMFRDSTKFYLYVALAFSVLIPYVLKRVNKGKMVSLLFIIFWGFTIHEALLGQLTGTFAPMPVPLEYMRLKDFLIAQPESFQTLWIPERQRFGFASQQHPALDARLLSGQSSVSGILTWIAQEDTKKKLDDLHVGYVVVPFDNRGELFLSDRAYDAALYNDTIQTLDTLLWLKKIDTFAPIVLYENTR